MVTESNYNELNFDKIRIGLASPDTIIEWSQGEVKKPETINYRTLKPEKEGLFCEKIFGPVKDWECHCGKYKRNRYKGKTCEKCGVKITRAKVRRERMGHIKLACPVSHIWYFKGIPSRIGQMLDITPRNLEKVLYFSSYIMIDPGTTNKKKYDILNDKQYEDLVEDYGEDAFKAQMGAEAIRTLLAEIDVPQLCAELRAKLADASGQNKAKLLKRLEVVEAFNNSGNRPEWMILTVIPVIPPDLRPMVQLDGGRFATSDLNDLYRRVINRNNRLAKLLDLGAPEIIVRNEKRMLQEAVDALIDNGRKGRPVTGPSNRPLKSLSDMLKGKQGRFRQNLLGKRVDYSGRSVIVVGPELKISQCGLPKEMALELFKPFVMKYLTTHDNAKNIRSAKKKVERAEPEVWDALEAVIADHPVMLNRAPTLHRLGIQAFEPVLVEGRAIKLHPLCCTAFTADFDGDQMAVHLPLSAEAQAEARFLMLAANNLLKPADGKPVTVPTQDMVLGSYYLTMTKAGQPGEGKVFASEDEAVLAYDNGFISLHSMIKVRRKAEFNGRIYTGLIETTLGRLIFNRPIPQDLGFVVRPSESDHAPGQALDGDEVKRLLALEVDFLVRKKELSRIIERSITVHGTAASAVMLDAIKAQGYKYSTFSGITFSVFDAAIPESKSEHIAKTEAVVAKITERFNRGYISDEKRSKGVIDAWETCTNMISEDTVGNLPADNPISMMVSSGARGNKGQLAQLAGMRGLVASTTGATIEIPIRTNYREGMNILEYFIGTRGARKGLVDTALRTADSGYLTRRLVDVSHDVVISEDDCGCREGLWIEPIRDSSDMTIVIESLKDRLVGRFLFAPVVDPETGEVVKDIDSIITEEDAAAIEEAATRAAKLSNEANGLDEFDEDAAKPRVCIRSLLTCESEHGVCVKCYGRDLATSGTVRIGEAVGIIAAQSIGEPGTQLTLRNFHSGGSSTASDITQGLPRVEELFEARKPKALAMLVKRGGEVIPEKGRKNQSLMVVVTPDGERDEYVIPYGFELTSEVAKALSLEDREHVADYKPVMVEQGQALTVGSINPHDLLEIMGVAEVHKYLIGEVQQVYRKEGVDISDKHIEVIVRRMLRKVRVVDPGSTDLIADSVIDKSELHEAIRAAKAKADDEGGEYVAPDIEPQILGITKASLATESFLSAASFQETTRVLTDAAVKGKCDSLLGLKENVIIGKLLPSGTGLKVYDEVKPVTVGTDSYFGRIEVVSE